ncbi:MAG: hypothetical protein KDB80_01755 [Planctomycetes bacterium]|nr:hypothetical protein [Planctomycetota bacterium]
MAVRVGHRMSMRELQLLDFDLWLPRSLTIVWRLLAFCVGFTVLGVLLVT